MKKFLMSVMFIATVGIINANAQTDADQSTVQSDSASMSTSQDQLGTDASTQAPVDATTEVSGSTEAGSVEESTSTESTYSESTSSDVNTDAVAPAESSEATVTEETVEKTKKKKKSKK